jgi:hypothetical protein
MNEKQVFEQHRQSLLAIPGVTAVALGHKITEGRDTGKHAVVVFVSRKRADVPEAERVPSEVGGMPTDVVEREFDIVDL